MRPRLTTWIGVLALAAAAPWPVVQGFAFAQTGDVIADAEMPTLTGGTHHLFSNATANVFIFFRAGQEHSQATLREFAKLEKETRSNSVHWVAIFSDRCPTNDIAKDVAAAGITMPVLVDRGDALYGRLGVALCPVVGITDKDHKLLSYQPFTKVNYTDVVRARLRYALKEIDAAELERVLHPPAATTPSGDASAAHRRLKLAERLFQAKNYEKALENVKTSIEKDPTLAAAHVLLARVLFAQGKREEAKAALQRALELDPKDTQAADDLKALSAPQ
jgi:tetratricopeptide (TPR) repeat protein